MQILQDVLQEILSKRYLQGLHSVCKTFARSAYKEISRMSHSFAEIFSIYFADFGMLRAL